MAEAVDFHPVLLNPIPEGSEGRILTQQEGLHLRNLGYACSRNCLVKQYDGMENKGVIYSRPQKIRRPMPYVNREIYVTMKVKSKNKNKLDRVRREVIERYLAGESTFDIARAFGVSAPTVCSLLELHGIDRRSLREAGKLAMTADRRMALSQIRKGRPGPTLGRIMLHRRGENSAGWRGGVYPLSQLVRGDITYDAWRIAVFTRDRYRCQTCGVGGAGLNAHHIIPFSEIMWFYEIKTLSEAVALPLLWDVDNGITLCKECHKIAHFTDKRPLPVPRVSVINDSIWW